MHPRSPRFSALFTDYLKLRTHVPHLFWWSRVASQRHLGLPFIVISYRRDGCKPCFYILASKCRGPPGDEVNDVDYGIGSQESPMKGLEQSDLLRKRLTGLAGAY